MSLFVTYAMLAAAQQTAPPVRRALLVGIGDYLHAPALEGPRHDVEAMKELLTGRFGFAAEDIRVLRDEEATKPALVEAFRDHLGALLPGGTAVFYFSGHGSFVADDQSDEEADGRDETLVTWDSGRGRKPNRDLTDDELAALVSELRTDDVTVILDSCHSGTASRGASRGRWVPGARGTVERLEDLALVGTSTPAAVSIAAAADEEIAFERTYNGVPHGALTHHLVQTLWTAPASSDHRTIVGQVRSRILADFRYQHAQLHGSALDRPWFGGTARPVPEARLRDLGAAPVPVHLGDRVPRGLEARLVALPDVRLVDGADEAWLRVSGRRRVVGFGPDGVLRFETAGGVGSVVDAVEGWSRWRQLVQLDAPPGGPSVELVLEGTRAGPASDPLAPVELTAGQPLDIVVTNNSDGPIYLGLFDLPANGRVALVAPLPGESGRLAPGETLRRSVMPVMAPSWPDASIVDVVRLVATTQPVDWTHVEQQPLRTKGDDEFAPAAWSTRSSTVVIRRQP